MEDKKSILNIFDIDETLFHTKAKVKVIKGGKVVRELNNQDFNTYKLGSGEKFDFGQFKSADIFNKSSTPVGRMIGKLKTILRNMSSTRSKVIFVTARSDFDNKKLFLDTFRSYDIDIDKIYVERSGNLDLGSSAKNKRFVFHKYLRQNKFNEVRLFDDSKQNLISFLSLAKNYRGVNFQAWLVDKDGKITRFEV